MAKDTWNRITGENIYGGIGVNSYNGMGEIRNMNISDEPGIAMVNRALDLELYGGTTEVGCTGAAATDYITVTSGSLANPGNSGTCRAVQFSATTIGGTATSTTYFIKYISANTYELYSDYNLTSKITITSDGSGTIDTIDVAEVESFYIDDANNTYYLTDTNDNVWKYPGTGQSLGVSPELLAGNSGNSYSGLVVWKNYLFAFDSAGIDVCDLVTNAGNITATDWTNNWKSITADTDHYAISAQDDAIYFCNKTTIGSIIEASGATFAPGTSASYTYNASALQLPDGYDCHYLAELGVNLMIATNDGRVYPWDRSSTQPEFPLQYPSTVSKMINTNNFLYTFHRPNMAIFVADSVTVKYLTKIPEYITNTFTSAGQPDFTSNIIRHGNKLLFGVGQGQNMSGVWSLNLDNNSLSFDNVISTGEIGGSSSNQWVYVNALGTFNPNSTIGSFKVFWRDRNETRLYGIDTYSPSGSAWYGSYSAFITTPLITIGDRYNKGTLKEIEVELDRPLLSTATTEGIKVAYRHNTNGTFTDLADIKGNGIFSGDTVYNFKAGVISGTQIQLRVYAQSGNATGATRCRIKEIRFR